MVAERELWFKNISKHVSSGAKDTLWLRATKVDNIWSGLLRSLKHSESDTFDGDRLLDSGKAREAFRKFEELSVLKKRGGYFMFFSAIWFRH